MVGDRHFDPTCKFVGVRNRTNLKASAVPTLNLPQGKEDRRKKNFNMAIDTSEGIINIIISIWQFVYMIV